MHREIGQHRQRFAVGSLHAQKTQPRIGRAGWTDSILVAVAGVHVGTHGLFAKRIDQFVPLQKRPTSASGKLGGVHPAPRCPGWLQPIICNDDRLYDFARQESAVARINPATETVAHRAGGAVAMRGGNQNAIERDAGFAGSQSFCLVAQVARQHATVHHHDGQACHAIVQHKASRVQRIDHLVVTRLQKTAVANHRQCPRRDVNLGRAGPKLCPRLGRQQ